MVRVVRAGGSRRCPDGRCWAVWRLLRCEKGQADDDCLCAPFLTVILASLAFVLGKEAGLEGWRLYVLACSAAIVGFVVGLWWWQARSP